MSESPLLAQLFTHCYVLSFAFKTQTYSYVFRLQTINYIITQLLYKLWSGLLPDLRSKVMVLCLHFKFNSYVLVMLPNYWS